MPEQRRIEDGHAEQTEHGVPIADQLPFPVLHHLVGLDRPGGGLGLAVCADVAGGVDGAVQLVDVLIAPNGAGGGQLDVLGQARGEPAGHAGAHLVVQHDLPGELHAAVGVKDFDIGGLQDPLSLVIDQGVGAQIAAIIAGLDFASRGGLRTAVVAQDRVRLKVDGAGDQPVGAGRGCRGWLGLGQSGPCTKARQRHPGQEAALDRGERAAPR
eukprot:GHVR01189345.1.p1 GENE.GHVR01189345.1~~GHVR01189345.1.p1  ORF type:complete len:213 (-),score=54.08 GHVR01189345.1:300-938(-)